MKKLTDAELAREVERDDALYLLYRRSKRPRETVRDFVRQNRELLEALIARKQP